MYKYDKKELLKTPEFYQMTTFEGTNFLSNYVTSRNEIISMISSEKTITQFSEIENLFTTQFKVLNKKELFLKDILTNDLFIFLLNSVMKSTLVDDIKEIVDLFLKKFEITKKFFTTYNLENKTTSGIHDNIDNYIIFSIICLKIYLDTKNLKYLNTCLKLNDILASKMRYEKNHDLSFLINFIIKNEIEIIKKLSKENDVLV